MGLLDSGAILLAECVINDTPTFLDNTNAYLHVGDSDFAFDTSQETLVGGETDAAGMEDTYPQRTDGTIVFEAEFGEGDANFAWEEWGIANNEIPAEADFLNREVESLGTKDGGTWTIAVSVTLESGD